MPESSTFDTAMTAWQEWQQAPWGQLRYAQAEANLARHLDDTPRRVLDLAGGDGADAIRLAASGHQVTIVDYAEQMLAAATRRFADAGLTDRLTTIYADAAELAGHVADGMYDVVLCHNLLQYVDDPTAILAAAQRPLRPGGLLSVMAINRDSEAMHILTRDLDPAAALAALDADELWTRTFNTTTRRYTAAQVTGWLEAAGCTVVGHYGIRTFNDYVYDNERKHDREFFDALLRLEMAAADRMPYPLIARFFHLVATANS